MDGHLTFDHGRGREMARDRRAHLVGWRCERRDERCPAAALLSGRRTEIALEGSRALADRRGGSRHLKTNQEAGRAPTRLHARVTTKEKATA